MKSPHGKAKEIGIISHPNKPLQSNLHGVYSSITLTVRTLLPEKLLEVLLIKYKHFGFGI